jgi:hypothetical protein
MRHHRSNARFLRMERGQYPAELFGLQGNSSGASGRAAIILGGIRRSLLSLSYRQHCCRIMTGADGRSAKLDYDTSGLTAFVPPELYNVGRL